MRVLMAAALAMLTSAAMADDIENAHKQTLAGRDSYWNCLAEEYTRDSNKICRGRISHPLSPTRVLPSGRISG